MSCLVVNKYKVNMADPDIEYIGRGSKWGNEYSHKAGTKALYKVKDRAEAIQQFRLSLWSKIKTGEVTVDELLELDGKRLACYCVPQACHGHVLARAVEWAKLKRGV